MLATTILIGGNKEGMLGKNLLQVASEKNSRRTHKILRLPRLKTLAET
jgi:hypothetical protein